MKFALNSMVIKWQTCFKKRPWDFRDNCNCANKWQRGRGGGANDLFSLSALVLTCVCVWPEKYCVRILLSGWKLAVSVSTAPIDFKEVFYLSWIQYDISEEQTDWRGVKRCGAVKAASLHLGEGNNETPQQSTLLFCLGDWNDYLSRRLVI